MDNDSRSYEQLNAHSLDSCFYERMVMHKQRSKQAKDPAQAIKKIVKSANRRKILHSCSRVVELQLGREASQKSMAYLWPITYHCAILATYYHTYLSVEIVCLLPLQKAAVCILVSSTL